MFIDTIIDMCCQQEPESRRSKSRSLVGRTGALAVSAWQSLDRGTGRPRRDRGIEFPPNSRRDEGNRITYFFINKPANEASAVPLIPIMFQDYNFNAFRCGHCYHDQP